MQRITHGTQILWNPEILSDFDVHDYTDELPDTRNAELSDEVMGTVLNQERAVQDFVNALTAGFAGIFNLGDAGTGKSTLTDGLDQAIKDLNAGEEVSGRYAQAITAFYNAIRSKKRQDVISVWDPNDAKNIGIINLPAIFESEEAKARLDLLAELKGQNQPSKYLEYILGNAAEHLQTKVTAVINTELMGHFAREAYRRGKIIFEAEAKKNDVKPGWFDLKYSIQDGKFKVEVQVKDKRVPTQEENKVTQKLCKELEEEMRRYFMEMQEMSQEAIIESELVDVQQIWQENFKRTKREVYDKMNPSEMERWRLQYTPDAESFVEQGLPDEDIRKIKKRKKRHQKLEAKVRKIFETEMGGLVKLGDLFGVEELTRWLKNIQRYMTSEINMEHLLQDIGMHIDGKKCQISELTRARNFNAVEGYEILVRSGKVKYEFCDMLLPHVLDTAAEHQGVRVTYITEATFEDLFGSLSEIPSDAQKEEIPPHARVGLGALARNDIVIIDDALGAMVRNEPIRKALYTFLQSGKIILSERGITAQLQNDCLLIGNDTKIPFLIQTFDGMQPELDEGMLRRFLMVTLDAIVENTTEHRKNMSTIVRQFIDGNDKYKGMHVTPDGMNLLLHYMMGFSTMDLIPMNVGSMQNHIFTEICQYAKDQGKQSIDARIVRAFVTKGRERAVQFESLLAEKRAPYMKRRTLDQKVGEVNVLAVSNGPYGRMGSPIPVTAAVTNRFGKVGSLDKNAQLVDQYFMKGVESADTFFNSQFGPTELQVNFGFQETAPVGGDSSSVVQLYALMSAMGNIPISQNIYVTGALDVDGNVGAIGGVYEKIRGAYTFHRQRKKLGKTKDPCVCFIPEENVKDILRELQFDSTLAEGIESGELKVFAHANIWDGFADMCGLEKEEYTQRIKEEIQRRTNEIGHYQSQITGTQITKIAETFAVAAMRIKEEQSS